MWWSAWLKENRELYRNGDVVRLAEQHGLGIVLCLCSRNNVVCVLWVSFVQTEMEEQWNVHSAVGVSIVSVAWSSIVDDELLALNIILAFRNADVFLYVVSQVLSKSAS